MKRNKKFLDPGGSDSWENRLLLIDGEFEEPSEEDDDAAVPTEDETELAQAVTSKIKKTRERRIGVPATSQRRSLAQYVVTRKLNKAVDKALCGLFPQIAVTLSLEARTVVNRLGKSYNRADVELVAEYFSVIAGLFEKSKRSRDAAYFRLVLIEWLTEKGGTETDLKEALALVPSTDVMFDPINDAQRRKKLADLKTEIRRLLTELRE